MPWKDPSNWSYLLSIYLLAPVLAFLTAMTRIFYDDHEPRLIRTLLESTICGLLAVASTAAVQALGLHDKWAVFFGGVIGFMGADYIRWIARDVIQQRSGGGVYRYHSYFRNRYRDKYNNSNDEGDR